MERTGMRRASLVLVGLVTMAWVGLFGPQASASGGGGCGAPVTDGSGTTVMIHNYCFGPTILHVRPGSAVTWVNRDPFSHTVLGANGVWGSFSQLRNGDSAMVRFARSGVYPYVCTFHAGMVGAVVVGSGRGRGAAHKSSTAAGPVTPVVPPPAAALGLHAAPRGIAPQVHAGAWPGIAVAAFGLVLLIGIAVTLERRSKGAGVF